MFGGNWTLQPQTSPLFVLPGYNETMFWPLTTGLSRPNTGNVPPNLSSSLWWPFASSWESPSSLILDGFANSSNNNKLASDKIVGQQSYTYKFDVPGFRPGEVDIKLDRENNKLVIEGKHKQQYTYPHENKSSSEPGSYSYSLCSSGEFYQSVTLDKDTINDPARVNARIEDGVLTVVLPRVPPPSQPPPPPPAPSKNIVNSDEPNNGLAGVANKKMHRIPIFTGPNNTKQQTKTVPTRGPQGPQTHAFFW